MRKQCLDHVAVLADQDDRVVFIGSDLSPGLLADMRQKHPARWFMEGVAEQNLVGMAAGLAFEGFIPYVNTIATFLTRRCYEQVAVDVCLHDLPVRLIANGGGLVYAPLGPTHEAVEDIAIMRALPNMTIVAPADAAEMVRFMAASLDWPHPIYIRLAKGNEPVITADDGPFVIGKAVDLFAAEGRDPIGLVATGAATHEALKAAHALVGEGRGLKLLHMPTVKPLDEDALIALARETDRIVTVEEHRREGGLGSAILELFNDRGVITPVTRLGLPDAFMTDYGDQAHLMKTHGVSADAILTAVVDAAA